MKYIILIFFTLLCGTTLLPAESVKTGQKAHILTIEEFIETAAGNDTVFEEILIDELSLKYSKNLQLPAKDLVLSIKSQYDLNLRRDEVGRRSSVSLRKLFPYTGTNISAAYSASPSYTSETNREFIVRISQPIAENAFGKATILLDKIIGTEIDIRKHQIVEAYEDYLATIMIVYYSWYSAYENLKIGESSYNQNLKLLENMKKRRSSNIALPIDVNKIKIQVLNKKESLIKLQERYENILNFIKQTIRYEGNEILEPADPFMYENKEISFDEDYDKFVQTSRTYKTLHLLEKKSSLEVKKDANSLLPSVNLLLGYTVVGEDLSVNPENLLFAGVSVTWPFPDQKDRARYETSKITEKKINVSNQNIYIQLHTDLKNLFIRIEREKKLISIAEEKIKLSKSILKDETQNYFYGKVTLNDFIDAVNRDDVNRFNKIIQSVQLKILMTEWLRITDQLISRKDIKKFPQ